MKWTFETTGGFFCIYNRILTPISVSKLRSHRTTPAVALAAGYRCFSSNAWHRCFKTAQINLFSRSHSGILLPYTPLAGNESHFSKTAGTDDPQNKPVSSDDSSVSLGPSKSPAVRQEKPADDYFKYAGDPTKDITFGFETSATPGPDLDIRNKEIVVKVNTTKGGRVKTDFSVVYPHNTFVPIYRAMTEFLLEPSEIDHLQKYSRRSPYGARDNIVVLKRTDLEKRAIDKWGSLENLQLQKTYKKARMDKQRSETSFGFEYLKTSKAVDKPYLYQPFNFYSTGEDITDKFGSTRVVAFALGCNTLNLILKFGAWLHTGSHSMFAEFIHSVADTANQVILAIGIRKSMKQPNLTHPYGFEMFRNISSLISGVGIFCLGAGLNIYHGIVGLMNPAETTSLYWALGVLAASFVTEGGTMLTALRTLRKNSQQANVPLYEYISRGIDPTTNVVLLEDFAAVLGTVIAATCISITQFTSYSIADPIGSLLIGTLLGGVATIIISTSSAALVRKSIPAEKRQDLVNCLESNRMIRTLIDVKATEAGGKSIQFKAEVDFDGREVTRFYLENVDIEKLLKDMQTAKTIEDAEELMLNHGEKIVDTLGVVVDRVEKDLKAKFPEIRHCDLEQL